MTSSFEIEDISEQYPDKPIKHKPLFCAFVAGTLLLPWASGAVMLLKKDKLEEWGWI